VKLFKFISTFAVINFIWLTFAQYESPKEIRISQGELKSFFGNGRIYNDIVFKNELEYNFADRTFYFHKKLNKRLKKIALSGNDFFDNKENLYKLDSTANNFTDYKAIGEKRSVYKIELIYFNHSGFPRKVKTMIFLYNRFISENDEKNIIEQTVQEYLKVIKNVL
jgi:hypothetical protein